MIIRVQEDLITVAAIWQCKVLKLIESTVCGSPPPYRSTCGIDRVKINYLKCQEIQLTVHVQCILDTMNYLNLLAIHEQGRLSRVGQVDHGAPNLCCSQLQKPSYMKF